MITGLIYLLVSVTLALLLSRLTSTREHEESGETETYGYSIQFGRFFLIAIVLAGLALAIVCMVWRPTGKGSYWVLPGFAFLGIGLPSLFYAYVSSYHVRIDATRIEVRSSFGRRSVDLATIAAIGVARGKGVDMTLYGRDDRCLATIGGSVQDFESLLTTLERRTRSPDVMLYRAAGFVIEEKPNDPRVAWRPSKGPNASRRQGLILLAIVGVGILVIGLAVHMST